MDPLRRHLMVLQVLSWDLGVEAEVVCARSETMAILVGLAGVVLVAWVVIVDFLICLEEIGTAGSDCLKVDEAAAVADGHRIEKSKEASSSEESLSKGR